METQNLLNLALDEIGKATKKADFARISELTKVAGRIQAIDAISKDLANELTTLAAKLSSVEPKQGVPAVAPVAAVVLPAMMGPLAIEIDWSITGRSFGKIVICERKASDTLRRFIEEIVRGFGADVLSKLAGVKASRGSGLLSVNPSRDFSNGKTGQIFQNQRVASTPYHVLTHNSTREKIEIVKSVARALSLTPGAIRVREVDVGEQASSLAREYVN
jgi:hypothetical protein